jgi:hypothetical protein
MRSTRSAFLTLCVAVNAIPVLRCSSLNLASSLQLTDPAWSLLYHGRRFFSESTRRLRNYSVHQDPAQGFQDGILCRKDVRCSLVSEILVECQEERKDWSSL